MFICLSFVIWISQHSLESLFVPISVQTNIKNVCTEWLRKSEWHEKMFQSFKIFIIRLHRLLLNKISHWQNVVKNSIFKCIYIASRDECLLFTLCLFGFTFSLTHTNRVIMPINLIIWNISLYRHFISSADTYCKFTHRMIITRQHFTLHGGNKSTLIFQTVINAVVSLSACQAYWVLNFF